MHLIDLFLYIVKWRQPCTQMERNGIEDPGKLDSEKDLTTQAGEQSNLEKDDLRLFCWIHGQLLVQSNQHPEPKLLQQHSRAPCSTLLYAPRTTLGFSTGLLHFISTRKRNTLDFYSTLLEIISSQ